MAGDRNVTLNFAAVVCQALSGLFFFSFLRCTYQRTLFGSGRKIAMPCGYIGGSTTSSNHPLVEASSVLCILVSAKRCLYFLSEASDGSADNTKKELYFVNVEKHCGETSVEDAVRRAKA